MPPKVEIILKKRQLKNKRESLLKNPAIRQCKLGKDVIVSLLQDFYELNNKRMYMDRSTFRSTFHLEFGITDATILDRLFNIFDSDADGLISPEEWVRGIVVMVTDNPEKNNEICFIIYNMKDDGYINREQVQFWLKDCFPTSTDDDPDEGVRDMAEMLLKKLDKDQDGKISAEDFKQSLGDDIPNEILGNIFPDPRRIAQYMKKILRKDAAEHS